MTQPSKSVFVVSQPNYDDDGVDSVWDTQEEALGRCAELGRALIVEYRVNTKEGYVRNGWAPAHNPPVWSDFGESQA